MYMDFLEWYLYIRAVLLWHLFESELITLSLSLSNEKLLSGQI